MNTPWWQEAWRRYAHITTPLRQRGLECDIAETLDAYIVRVTLPDGSRLVIGPPLKTASERSSGEPEGWIVTRRREVIYDSAPAADPGAPVRPEAQHRGSTTHLIAAIDRRLIELGLLPARSSSSPGAGPLPPPAHTALDPQSSAHRADQEGQPVAYTYGDALLALTDLLNGTESYTDAAALLHQIADPVNGLLERLGDFLEAAGEKAKEAEQDDGFDLSYDLADAAAEIRGLVEVLGVAEDRMRALSPIVQIPRSPSTPARPASLPQPALPPTQFRHMR
ncbi:hypothetical protein [Streptomyces sp. NPDC046860]|uniref:hypothetical protein n=1 Tax=Streptomyces sp. NPDC046860 TaxID=3154495 RepID=UPI0033E3F6A5